MPRSENGSVVGARNATSINNAVGVFNAKSQFNANMSGYWPRSGNIMVALAHTNSPYISVYSFSSLGFGSKFSDPGTLPTGTGNAVRFNSTGKVIAVAHTTTPFISTYPWTTGSGFGSKYSNPGTLPASTGNDVVFNSVNNIIVVGHSTTPGIAAYLWSDSTGFGTKYANPSTVPVSGYGVDFYQNDVLIGAGTTPYIMAYPIDSVSGFGTKYGNPAATPPIGANDVKFNPSGTVAIVTSGNTPYVTAYPWSGAGFGTKYSNPTITNIGGDVNNASFAPGGGALVVANADISGANKYIFGWPWNDISGFGSPYSFTASTLPNTGNGVGFHPQGNFIFFGHTSSPYISAFPWSDSTALGTKLANPGTLPAGAGRRLDIKII
jgi:hypothetical protein